MPSSPSVLSVSFSESGGTKSKEIINVKTSSEQTASTMHAVAQNKEARSVTMRYGAIFQKIYFNRLGQVSVNSIKWVSTILVAAYLNIDFTEILIILHV